MAKTVSTKIDSVKSHIHVYAQFFLLQLFKLIDETIISDNKYPKILNRI